MLTKAKPLNFVPANKHNLKVYDVSINFIFSWWQHIISA